MSRAEYYPTLRRTSKLEKQRRELERLTRITSWSGLIEFVFGIALAVLKHPICPHCGHKLTEDKGE